jgi:hypothetical protein
MQQPGNAPVSQPQYHNQSLLGSPDSFSQQSNPSSVSSVSPPDPDQSKAAWRSNDIPKAPALFGNMNRSHPGAFSPTYGMSGPISPGLHPQESHDFSNQSSSIESFALPLPIGKSAFKSVSFATLGMHAARGLPVFCMKT